MEKKKPEPYGKPLAIRLKEHERAEWERLAKGKTLSAFVRGLVEASKRDYNRPPAKPKKRVVYKDVSPDLLASLARIGNNVNQLARKANESGELPTLVALASLEREIKRLRDAG